MHILCTTFFNFCFLLSAMFFCFFLWYRQGVTHQTFRSWSVLNCSRPAARQDLKQKHFLFNFWMNMKINIFDITIWDMLLLRFGSHDSTHPAGLQCVAQTLTLGWYHMQCNHLNATSCSFISQTKSCTNMREACRWNWTVQTIKYHDALGSQTPAEILFITVWVWLMQEPCRTQKCICNLQAIITSETRHLHYLHCKSRVKIAPGLIPRHHCLTSLMLFCLNGSKYLQPVSSIWWKAWNLENGGCCTLMPMVSQTHMSKMFG